MKILALTLTIILFYSGCSRNIPTPDQRLNKLMSLKDDQTINKVVHTDNFNLFTMQKFTNDCTIVKVYIEGDGLAWITRSRISSNPTPINPIALKLMNLDNSKCKIYIARPCQYNTSKNCNKKYWTSHRFNEKVIDSYISVLDMIKKDIENKTYSLIGYSGGAAVALLVAANRDDIENITTIAGNLDHKKWTDIFNLTALNGSLNPADYSNKLENILQYHLIGTDDNIIPKDIFDSYKLSFSNSSNINYKFYNATHSKNWEESYKKYLMEFEKGIFIENKEER